MLILVLCVQIGTSTCCPECGDYCGGEEDYHDDGYYVPTSVVSISHTLTTPSSSSQPSGTTVDYHVQSKADKLEGYTPLKIHFWDESSATQGVTAVSYEWDLGDGTKETKKDFTHTYSSPGTFKVIPKVTWSDGKVSTGKAAAIRAYQGTATASTTPSGTGGESTKPSGTDVDYHVKSKADTLEGYAPLTIKFSDESWATKGVVPTGYEWDMGDGTTKTDKSFSYTYSSPGTYIVTPTVTFSDGKVSTGSPATIEVAEGVSLKSPETEIPTTTPIETPGDILPDLKVTDISPKDMVTPGSSFSVDITVSNDGGSPAGAFIIGGYLFAVSDYQKSIDLSEESVSSLGPGETVNKTLTADIPADSPTGAYDLKAYADNSNYTDAGQVTESNENNNEKWAKDVKPTATVTPTPTTECEYSCQGYGTSVTLDSGEIQGVLSAGGESTCDTVTGVTWDMGDGTTKTTANNEEIKYTYTTPGTYNPTFSISWESGKNFDSMCEANIEPITVAGSVTKTPTPEQTPEILPTFTPTMPPTPEAEEIDYYLNARDDPIQGEAPHTVEFQDMSYATHGVTPVRWTWDLGDGSSASEQSFSHTYPSPGVYHVTDTVTFSDGYVLNGVLSPDIRVVEYYPKMIADPTEGDAPLVVTFKDSSSATTGVYPVAWAWEGDDGGNGFTSNQQTFSHTYTKPGTYEWTGGVVFSDGKTKTEHGTIIVHEKVIPEDKIYYYNELIPNPEGGEAPLSVNFEDHSYATHGVTVAHLHTDLGDGTIVEDQTAFNHVYQNPGTYYVKHTITYSDGYIGVVGFYIRVYETIAYYVQISVQPLYGIAPLPVSFTDLSYATGGVYVTGRVWDFGDDSTGEGKVTQHTYEKAGTYTVCETVTFSDGHEEMSDTREVVVVEPEKSEGVETSDWEVVKGKAIEYYLVQMADPREGFAPLTVRFEDQSSTNKPDITASAWKWDLGDGQSSTEQKFTHEYTTNGTYEVTISVTFSDGHEQAGDPITIEVTKEGVETSSFTTDHISDEATKPEKPVSGEPTETAEVTPTPTEASVVMKSEKPSDVGCIEDEIFSRTNEMYTGGDYVRDAFLNDMARQYSALLCEKDQNKLNNKVEPKTFSHELIGAPDGLKTRFDMSGYQYTCIAENIGHNPVLNDGSGCTDTECTDAAAKIMDGWKNSPLHYKNIMNENGVCKNTNIGIGVYECGDGCYYATQIFATPAKPDQKSEKGILTVTTDPTGASAYVDGKAAGTTPTGQIEVIPGYDHTVDAFKDGYTSTPQKVTVKAGETKSVPITLKSEPGTTGQLPSGEKGTITVTSEPSGATVAIDSSEGGVTPSGPIEATAGSHEVSVSMDGYTTKSQTVTVEAGKDTPVSITLDPVSGEPPEVPPVVPPETPPQEPPQEPTDTTPATPTGNNAPVNPVTTGGLSFVSTPSGAMVQLGGLIINEQTPFQINAIPAGQYQVRFILGDQESMTRIVTVVADQVIEVAHTFPDTGTQPGTGPATTGQQPGTIGVQTLNGALTLETMPSGADVYINNWPVGQTPIEGMAVNPGTYLISFVKNGYIPEIVTAVIPSGGQVFISRSLTPLAGTKPTGPVQTKDLGTLKVGSTPEGALIFIDGFQVNGKTPIIISDFPTGQYDVQVSLNGYNEYAETVSIESGKTTTIDADLKKGEEPFDPLANLGTITVTSTPDKAEIFLNGFLQPEKTPADLTLINPGKHYVEVKKQGYDTFKQDLIMPEGGTLTVNAVLITGGDEDATFTTEGSSDQETVPGTPEPIGDSTGLKKSPGISGNRIIWAQKEGGRSVAYLYDEKTGTSEAVKSDSYSQEEPVISGNYAVWSTGGPESDIILKDLKTGIETKITNDELKQYAPYTDGINVVYIEEGESGSPFDIVLYSIASQEKKVIATGESEKSNPVIDGDYIVFEEMKSGTLSLILYQISTEVESLISKTGEVANPDMKSGKIVFEDYRDGNADIYLYDIASKTETVVVSGPGDQVRPSVSGDHIVFEETEGDELSLLLYTISTGKTTTIAPITGSAYPQINDGVIIFLDKGGTVLNRYSLA